MHQNDRPRALEPVLCNKGSHPDGNLRITTRGQPLLKLTTESTSTAPKTQCSQRYKTVKKEDKKWGLHVGWEVSEEVTRWPWVSYLRPQGGCRLFSWGRQGSFMWEIDFLLSGGQRRIRVSSCTCCYLSAFNSKWSILQGGIFWYGIFHSPSKKKTAFSDVRSKMIYSNCQPSPFTKWFQTDNQQRNRQHRPECLLPKRHFVVSRIAIFSHSLLFIWQRKTIIFACFVSLLLHI